MHFAAFPPAIAQGLKSGPYELPYKNTYVKNVFVSENEFRIAEPEVIIPGTFEEAVKILPAPFWGGHEKVESTNYEKNGF